MKNEIEESKIKELKKLLDEATYVPTKSDARPIIQRLQLMSSHLGNEIDDYHLGKLSEAIGFAQEASGRVQNKEHWIQSMNMSWYVFENGIKKIH